MMGVRSALGVTKERVGAHIVDLTDPAGLVGGRIAPGGQQEGSTSEHGITIVAFDGNVDLGKSSGFLERLSLDG
jgi:hypothetical protein